MGLPFVRNLALLVASLLLPGGKSLWVKDAG
jgi:hypothetical protein